MKTRVLTIIIALLGMAAGAQAAGTYTLELYDGMSYNSMQMNAILALAVNGDLTMEESGSVKTYKRNSTKLFSVNTANATISVPRTVTRDNGFSAYPLNYTATVLMGNNYSSIYLTFSIAINSQNFPDANFRTWVKSQSYGSDGILTTPEIVDATSINVKNKSISNILGIEYFTNLTKLDCPKNQLTSLDVWRNTLLSELYCYENKLTSLDVSKNTLLKELECSDNQLTSLDVSKSTKLAYLDCKGNRLTSLKVSTSASGLTLISCYGNRLSGSSMDAFISSLPKVANGTLNVRDISLSTDNSMTYAQIVAAKQKGWTPMIKIGNVMQEYDGSDAIIISSDNFPDTNFRSWVSSNCDVNYNASLSVGEIAAVTSINVSGKNISNLKGIEYFTALTNLYCSNNQLTALDVSKNTSLRLIECYKNKLRGTAVDNLISSLPRKSGADLNFYNNETSTGNSMTSAQVQAAKQKGWTPRMMSIIDGSSAWAEYAGSDAIAIDATNFPDANFRNWVKAQSYGEDGYLSPAEIAGVTSISVSGLGVTTLKGIEFFTALKYLNCESSDLTELDVSNNTALKELHCGANPYLKKLNVSNNTELTKLGCYNCQLTSLDVSDCLALVFLNCYGNKIQGSGMATLVNSLPTVASGTGTFEVYNDNGSDGNEITNAQVEAAKAKGWRVQTYNGDDYPGSDAIAIDATNFPDPNFRAWLMKQSFGKDGYLTPAERARKESFYLNEEGIASLKGIEFFTALTFLRCDYNQLTELDVSKNTALTELYCGNNQLTSLDVSKNTLLKELVCDNNRLTSLDVSKNTALSLLACDGVQLTSLDVSNNTALKTLYCDNNQLTSLDVSKNTALTTLSCLGNQLTSLDVSKNTVLAVLWCFNNQIRGKEMTDLVNSLPDCNSTSEEGNLYVYKNETATGNAMTVVQVEAALQKGWAVYYWNDAMNAWVPYFGEVSNGDANGDSEVTAEDVETIRNYILGIVPSSFVFEAADMNGNGEVDIVDLTKLIKKLKK